MNHFTDALRNSIAVLKNASMLASIDKVCLIVDLEGRFRILAKPDGDTAAETLKRSFDTALQTCASPFWTGEVWVETGNASHADLALFSAVWANATAETDNLKVHVLHRRVSKDAWFHQSAGPPWPLHHGQTPPILSFYSYKGGVGRSTALASVAIQQARKGRRVLVIDFDLEAPGLASMFPPPEGGHTGIGAVDFFLEYPIAGNDFAFEDIHYTYDNQKAIGDTGGEIRIIPAGTVDTDYLEKLSRINYQRMLPTGGGNPAPGPIDALLKQCKRLIKPDLILIDSRAGLHDMGGLALSPLVHRHILFGLDSEQSWRGLRLAIRHLGGERVLRGDTQQQCTIVHCMASPKQEIREASVQRFLERSHEIFSEHYYDDPDQDAPEYPVPDLVAPDQPHSPVVLKHSEEIMGYNTAAEAADALCGPDYLTLATRILPE